MQQWIMVSVWTGIFLLSNGALGSCYEAVTVTNGGTLAGTVRFRGTPPREVLEITKDQNVCGKTEKINESLIVGEDFGVENAVVSLVNIAHGKAFPTMSATVDQRECRYLPHVVLVPAGGEVTILNNDGILHNIHTQSSINPPLNKAQPKFKKVMKEVFSHPETIRMTCDAHAWMNGWLIVMEHPYYAVTDARGHFQVENIPPGDYAVKVWHEVLPEQVQQVKIVPRHVTNQEVELVSP